MIWFIVWLLTIVLMAFGFVGPSTLRAGRIAIRTVHWYWGVEKSTIWLRGKPYLTRWIMYLGPVGLRLHRFTTGDDDTAPHDHPFWFITFPLGTSYWEKVYDDSMVALKPDPLTHKQLRIWNPRYNMVKAWRFVFRPSSYRHIVVEPVGPAKFPLWTFCIFGFTDPDWGFWPNPDTKVHWLKWDAEHNRGTKDEGAKP